ncbi:MAG: sensor histidine kinase, partial [Edaphobacter sp.]
YFLAAPLREGHEEMVGKRLEEIFAPERALGAAVLRAFAEGAQVSAKSVTLEDGRQVQISLDRIDDGLGGGNMGTLLTLRDMESVAQLGQELEVARRLAAIGKLTAGVGHEVKNPINAMVVHLELLRGKLTIGGVEAFAGAHRHVDILAGEMQRLDRVVQTLADFSRPMELHLREHDLRKVIAVVLDLMAAEMEENGVRVVIDAPQEALMVRADAELMQQAVLNLVLNGMQAMPGGGELRVVMRREHQFAVVEVMDKGEGIPVELLPRIFELYFTTKPKGSGIGLAMTYRILQLHGGAMDVRSNADPNSQERGTVFTFRLPIVSGVGVEGRKIVTAGASHKGIEERV